VNSQATENDLKSSSQKKNLKVQSIDGAGDLSKKFVAEVIGKHA
jgi:hypothetical protein